MMNDKGRPIEMLLVEDNEADIRLTEIALQQSKLENRLHVVRDGEQALAFLKNEGPFVDAVRPDILLLDLNLPKLGGTEVLKEIRGTKALKSLPVVILTTSDADKDIYESYELQANCYITKPADLRKFMGVVEMIEDFWERVSKPSAKD